MNLNNMKDKLGLISEFKDVLNIKKSLEKESLRLIHNRAEQLTKNIFVFDKHWDMERCIKPYQLEKDFDWNVQLNDDEEWCFMLNRMDYLNYLIMESCISKDDIYALKAKSFILSWIGQHPSIESEPSTRTLDTGIRLMNWFEALPYLLSLKLLNDHELALIVSNMKLQAEYLKNQYLNRYITSNWGSIQTFSLCSVLPFITENYEEDELYKWALNECMKQMNVQVYPDGMHWEQSTMYHVEVLNYGMKYVFYNRFIHSIDGEKIKQNDIYSFIECCNDKDCTSFKIEKIVFNLANCLFLQSTPEFQIETFGDTDRTSIQDVMCRASYLFNNPEFKYAGFDLFDSESLYSFGCNAAKKYLNINKIIPLHNVFDGNDSGMYVSRSSWKKDANFVMFTNGSLGSGHGHSDNLHVSIYHNGKPICIDSGRYTYREDHPLRTKLKSPFAHNSVILDEKSNCVPNGSWTYSDFGLPLKNYVKHKDGFHYYEGAMMGHDPLQVINRKFIFIESGIYLTFDSVFQDGAHQAKTRFHIDPSISFSKKPLCFYTNGEVNVAKDVCSLRYNELLDHDVVTSTLDFNNEGHCTNIFYDPSFEIKKVDVLQNGDKKVDDSLAEAYQFESEKEKHIVVIFHKEIYQGKKVFFVNGHPFHGKCMWIHQCNDAEVCEMIRA